MEKLLQSHELKSWLHKRLSRLDKLLIILSTFDQPVQVKDVISASVDAGFRDLRKWNISSVLGGSGGKAIRAKAGWELTNAGLLHLRDLGIADAAPAALQVAIDLRRHLEKLPEGQTKKFIEEAIKCHEFGLYRAEIVMTLLGAIDVLHHLVFDRHLREFNSIAQNVYGKKWKIAKRPDDLGRIGESEFLDRLENISVIGKNVKAQLQTCLDLRNGCGHPNSMRVSVNKSAAHIETLLQNVFEPFLSDERAANSLDPIPESP